MINLSDITGLILAGGRGSRMGGVDKGLQSFNGVPLALHTLLRLQMQEGGPLAQVMINANRNLAAYEAFGAPVWPDVLADYAGPLAGFLTGLERCESPYLITTPCDTPLFPLDLVARLAQAMHDDNADIAMVTAPEPDAKNASSLQTEKGQPPVRPQPVFCLLRVELLESLARFTQDGGRKIDAWTDQHSVALVPFDLPQDDPRAFFNANTLAELQSLQSPKLRKSQESQESPGR
jgi:molybdenum cofactor guanylyltransferase